MPRRPRGSRLGGSSGVPMLVPVRASPVPSVVRGSFVVKFFSVWGRQIPPSPAARGLLLSKWLSLVVNELACVRRGRSSARISARRLRRSRLGGSRGVPVLVPVRASPVPSVVRGSLL